MTAKLITIAPSHYCEKSRWCLDLSGIKYTEEPHAPFFHISPVKRAGGVRSTPVLQLESETLPTSDAITEWIARQPDINWHPYGTGEYQTEMREMEIEFGRKLGKLTRLATYRDLLPHKNLFLSCMSTTPLTEQRWLSMGFPIFSWLIGKSLNINESSCQRAVEAIYDIFDMVEDSAKGDFLIGNSLSIADISFAAISAPVILPEGYGSPLPKLVDLPEKAQQLIDSFRSTAAGQRVIRLYQDHRPTKVQ